MRGAGWERRLFEDILRLPARGRNWNNEEDKIWLKGILHMGINEAKRMGIDLSGKKTWTELRSDYQAMYGGISSMKSLMNGEMGYAICIL